MTAAILVTDIDIEEPREMVPLMQEALRCGITQLLLIVGSISEKGRVGGDRQAAAGEGQDDRRQT